MHIHMFHSQSILFDWCDAVSQFQILNLRIPLDSNNSGDGFKDTLYIRINNCIRC